MNFISKIIRRESSSSDDSSGSNEKAYSPTLPPRPSPKVVEELDLPSSRTTSKRRPLSFAERFKKEQVPPTLPRPSPRTVRRITKSTKTKEKSTKTKKKTTTSIGLAIRPIQKYAIKFLNRLRRRGNLSEEDVEQVDDESLLRRSLITLNRSPLVMNISLPQAPSKTQLEKDLTREILNINGTKYEEHISMGSPEAGFEVLHTHLIILVTRLLGECDDLKVRKVVRRALNSCCRM